MLYLLPNLLDQSQNHELFLPRQLEEIIPQLDGLIAESDKAARVFLKRFRLKKTLQETPVHLLNEHTTKEDLKALVEPLEKGQIWGLISDAGLPCIADPGAQLVRLLHARSIPVHAISGPSSIVLALMMSGFSGQRFSFHGYLPKEEKERHRQILFFEEDARRYERTQIFIEVPYRSEALLKEFLKTLKGDTMLSVAYDITLPTEKVIAKSVKEWQKIELPDIQKKPAIFLLASSPR